MIDEASPGLSMRMARWLVALLLIVSVPACSPESQEFADSTDAPGSPFEACVAERDRRIHQQVFATVDNPDVQRELLITRKEKAIRECRDLYPEP